MPDEAAPQTSTVSRHLEIRGYLVDHDALRRIDSLAREFVGTSVDVKSRFEIRAQAPDGRQRKVGADSIETLAGRLDEEAADLNSLSMRYFGRTSRVTLDFDAEGHIRVTAYGPSPDVHFSLDRLADEIRACDQTYHWAIKTFVFDPGPRRLLGLLLFLQWFLLLCGLGIYAYGRVAGVNVDPSIIPGINSYVVQIQDAIRSNDLSKKLNVLLMTQMVGFSNVRDVLAIDKEVITFLLIGIALCHLLVFVRRRLKALYPTAFFLFGRQEQVWSRLVRRREIWAVAVLIGFIVNLVAGVVIAVAMGR